MKHSFGVTMGRAAIVLPGHDLFYIAVNNEKATRLVREALHKVKAKVPGRTKIIFEKLEMVKSAL